ncbi:MAG: hypothetical protein AAGD32_05020 [Planctomycetota bacterium]
MLEKPVAGCIQEHDAIANFVNDNNGRVLIGFQDIYRHVTHELKRRLLAGDFGRPKAVSVAGVWPRHDAYYSRNTWAGALSAKASGCWTAL